MVRRRFVEYFPSLVCLVEPSLEALFLLPVIVLKSFPIIQHILRINASLINAIINGSVMHLFLPAVAKQKTL